MSDKQPNLFGGFDENFWESEWIGMPEYSNILEPEPFITATFKFRNQEDFDEFNRLIKEHLYEGEKPFDGNQRKTVKSTWFPLKIKARKFRYK
jgi:hypothetical protein